MKRFVTSLGVFSTVQLGIFIVIVLVYKVDSESYMASTLDKHARMATCDPPRIIFVGGSNVAFGTDSRRVQTYFGRDTVNMSIQAAVGLDVMLREIEDYLGEGDTVLLSFEYQHFYRDLTNSQQVLWRMLEQRPTSWHNCRWTQFRALADSGLAYLGAMARADIRRVTRACRQSQAAPARRGYTRAWFNEFGDVVAHWKMRRKEVMLSDAVMLGIFSFSVGESRAVLAEK